MKSFTLLLVLMATLVLIPSCAHHGSWGDGDTGSLGKEIEFAKARIYPCLVNISVVSKAFIGGRTRRNVGAGSGTIVSAKGHVLTNYHVARDATRIICTLATGEQIPADIVGDDSATDLSVLKLRLHERANPDLPLPHAKLGDSDKLKVGHQVIAVGNPLSLSSSMTLGIVSNTKRVFMNFAGNQMQELDFGSGNMTGMFTVWIQHDALILPGNSGGPLVNLKGEVIGVNTRGGNGYGFASPANLVKHVYEQILAHGEVKRGFIGTSFMPVDKLGRKTGVMVSSLVPTSPAEKAGIKPGDIILKVGELELNCRFFEQVPMLYGKVARLPANQEMTLVYIREGKKKKVQVTVAPMDKYVGKQIEFRRLGITIQDITGPMALARRYPNTKGVLVTGMRAGEPFEAAKPRIFNGDVILNLDGKKIDKIADFVKAVGGCKAKEAAMVFRRGSQILVTLVKLDKDKRRKPGGNLPLAWLGVKTQVLTKKVCQALDLKGKKGFRITQVFPWTKAREAGLQVGDLILALDEEPLDSYRPQDAKDLKNLIEDMSIGDDAELTIFRGGKELNVEVELEESPGTALEAKTAKNKELEFKVRDLTFMDRISRKLTKDQTGVLVTDTTSGGWASIAGLSKGDIICAMQGKVIKDVKSFKKIIAALLKAKPKVIPVFVRRGYRTSFVFIEPDWAKAEGGK